VLVVCHQLPNEGNDVRAAGFLDVIVVEERPGSRVGMTYGDNGRWIAWNDDPRPLVWTKTADEILDTVAG
jgi:hypothetical protein